jgi:hypothetical protein
LLAGLRSFAEVDDVVDLLTMRLGTAQLLVAARLDFGPQLSSDQIEQVSTRIERRVHERFPQVQQIFLHPTAVGMAPRLLLDRRSPSPPGPQLMRGCTVPARVGSVPWLR